jgi:hypothetical protein
MLVAIGLTVDAHAMGQPHRRWPFPVPVATSDPRSYKMRIYSLALELLIE